MSGWPWAFAGLIVGTLSFLLLEWTVNRIRAQEGRHTWLWLGLGGLLRILLAGAMLLLAVKQGLSQVLFAFVGLWLTRWVLVVWYAKRKATP